MREELQVCGCGELKTLQRKVCDFSGLITALELIGEGARDSQIETALESLSRVLRNETNDILDVIEQMQDCSFRAGAESIITQPGDHSLHQQNPIDATLDNSAS